MKFRKCVKCGAHLDPNERCDCTKKDINKVEASEKSIKIRLDRDKQYTFLL